MLSFRENITKEQNLKDQYQESINTGKETRAQGHKINK